MALKIWAIGIKIQGLSLSDLREKITFKEITGAVANHPNALATVPGTHSLLGGGFKVNFEVNGNIATGSFPDSSVSWTAQSKDYYWRDKCSMTVFAIGIETNLVTTGAPPTVIGRIVTTFNSVEPLNAASWANVFKVPVINGFALCGGGAEAHWTVGQYLWNLEPSQDQNQSTFTAQSKDLNDPDPNRITGYAMGVLLIPS